MMCEKGLTNIDKDNEIRDLKHTIKLFTYEILKLREEIKNLEDFKEWAYKELNSNGDGKIHFLNHIND